MLHTASFTICDQVFLFSAAPRWFTGPAMTARPKTGVSPAADPHMGYLRAIADSRDTASFCALFLHSAPRGIGAPEAEELAWEMLLNIWRKALCLVSFERPPHPTGPLGLLPCLFM